MHMYVSLYKFFWNCNSFANVQIIDDDSECTSRKKKLDEKKLKRTRFLLGKLYNAPASNKVRKKKTTFNVKVTINVTRLLTLVNGAIQKGIISWTVRGVTYTSYLRNVTCISY